MTIGINRDEWLTALTAAGVAPAENDASALTAREFAALFSTTKHSAAKQLAALVKAGKARQTSKRYQDAAGRWQYAPAYRLAAK